MKNLVFILMCAFCVVSCSEPRQNLEAQDEVTVIPRTSIEISGEATQPVESRMSTAMYREIEYGLWVHAVTPGANEWYYSALGYDNVKMGYYHSSMSGKWTLGIFKSKGPVYFHAYHPYNADFKPENADAVPFIFYEDGPEKNNFDYAYVEPVYVDPNDPATLKPVLNLKHVMTMIEFNVSTTMAGTLRVVYLRLEAVDKNDGTPKNIFGLSGTYSALDGSLSPSLEADQWVNKMAVKIENHSHGQNRDLVLQSPSFTKYGIIFTPVSAAVAADTKLTATLVFDYNGPDEIDDELTGQGSTIEIDLGAIKTGGTARGLASGYRYVIPVKVDNFIKYNGTPVIMDWENEVDEYGNEVIHDMKF